MICPFLAGVMGEESNNALFLLPCAIFSTMQSKTFWLLFSFVSAGADPYFRNAFPNQCSSPGPFDQMPNPMGEGSIIQIVLPHYLFVIPPTNDECRVSCILSIPPIPPHFSPKSQPKLFITFFFQIPYFSAKFFIKKKNKNVPQIFAGRIGQNRKGPRSVHRRRPKPMLPLQQSAIFKSFQCPPPHLPETSGNLIFIIIISIFRHNSTNTLEQDTINLKQRQPVNRRIKARSDNRSSERSSSPQATTIRP